MSGGEAERDLQRTRGDPPWTLVVGVIALVAIEALLWTDVVLRGGAMAPRQELPEPEGWLGVGARTVAVNMTPLAWVAYLMILDGAMMWAARLRGGETSPVRVRPRLFALCALTSVPIWLFYDWLNFSFMHAWEYHNLPDELVHRWLGYFVAFATINPGMFLTAEAIRRIGLREARRRPVHVDAHWQAILITLGVLLLATPFAMRAPAPSALIWPALFLIFDPINDVMRAPSLVRDWRAGRWGRTISLLLGGLACGFLWEFWNYWAVAKWTYDLPFLGPLESVRLFEMPLLGFLGFPPFAVAVWAAFQTIAAVVRRLSPRLIEPPPEDATL